MQYSEVKFYLGTLFQRFSVPYHIDLYTSDIMVNCTNLLPDQCYALKRYSKAIWAWSNNAHAQGYFLEEFHAEFPGICLKTQSQWPARWDVPRQFGRLMGPASRLAFFEFQDTYRVYERELRNKNATNPLPRELLAARRVYWVMKRLTSTKITRVDLANAVHTNDHTICTLSSLNGKSHV